MSTAKRLHYSYDEYRRSLELSQIKLEYCDGVIYAMAGGTVAHGQLSAAAMAVLRAQLVGSCRVFSSDVLIRVESSDLSTYPDASVVCGELARSRIDPNALTNPSILVEVTSKSTEDYDRGDKLSHYKQLPSLRAVLIISHRTRAITVIERSGAGWSERVARSGEAVTLAEPRVTLSVDDVYFGVELEPD
ncbi:MAG: Uma2 family endonuclease [Myxococcota bacterium]